MKFNKSSDNWVTQQQMNNLITCVDNLATSVSFIVAALQATNMLEAQHDQAIASLEEELRTLRADLNLRGGA